MAAFFSLGEKQENWVHVFYIVGERRAAMHKLRMIVTQNIPCEQDVIANIVYCKSYSRRNAFFKNRSKEEDDL